MFPRPHRHPITELQPTTEPRTCARALRRHPALLLPAGVDDATVRRLVREWNPAAALPQAAEGVYWAGPFALTPAVCAEAGLAGLGGQGGLTGFAGLAGRGLTGSAGPTGGWCTAYAAVCARSRTRVPDGLDAHLLRMRYPHGIPAGDEALAWSLVTGLARRLGGATRLPGGTRRATLSVAAQRAGAQENSYCVYGHEALPWSVLRSVLCLSLPELDRNGLSAANDYCLDRPGGFEVRVRPFDPGGFVPHALRPRVDADWPGTVYRFGCLPQANDPDADRIDAQLRAAACQLADVVGGVLLDGDGFPLTSVSRVYSAV